MKACNEMCLLYLTLVERNEVCPASFSVEF